jgi:hypothetical protein
MQETGSDKSPGKVSALPSKVAAKFESSMAAPAARSRGKRDRLGGEIMKAVAPLLHPMSPAAAPDVTPPTPSAVENSKSGTRSERQTRLAATVAVPLKEAAPEAPRAIKTVSPKAEAPKAPVLETCATKTVKRGMAPPIPEASLDLSATIEATARTLRPNSCSAGPRSLPLPPRSWMLAGAARRLAEGMAALTDRRRYGSSDNLAGGEGSPQCNSRAEDRKVPLQRGGHGSSPGWKPSLPLAPAAPPATATWLFGERPDNGFVGSIKTEEQHDHAPTTPIASQLCPPPTSCRVQPSRKQFKTDPEKPAQQGVRLANTVMIPQTQVLPPPSPMAKGRSDERAEREARKCRPDGGLGRPASWTAYRHWTFPHQVRVNGCAKEW